MERDRARAAETAARLEKVRAESIADFLQGVLRSTGAPVLVSDSTDSEISPVSTSIGQMIAQKRARIFHPRPWLNPQVECATNAGTLRAIRRPQ